jgi:hypothetical protein
MKFATGLGLARLLDVFMTAALAESDLTVADRFAAGVFAVHAALHERARRTFDARAFAQ